MNKAAQTETNQWQYYGAILLSALCLLIPAIYNHYPLVNPDVATYLASGFKPETPMDRPITYGLLMRLFSVNGLSAWLIVFVQAYLVSWLLFMVLRGLNEGKPYLLKGVVVICGLSVCSSLSWLVSQLQPDGYTAIALLCIYLILTGRKGAKNAWLLYVLFFISVAVHLSHPLLFAAILLFLLMTKKIYADKIEYRRINIKIAVLIVLSLASILIMGPALSKSKHVFFVGSLLEKGVLKRYLDDRCAEKNYKICAYKDSLPTKADDFWWNNNSPLYKVGDWKGSKQEFNAISHDVLTTPKYLSLYLAASVKQALQQLITVNIGDGNTAFPTGTPLNGRMAEYFPRDLQSFDKDKQNTSSLGPAVTYANNLFAIIIVCSLVFLCYALLMHRRLPQSVKLLFIVCLTGIVFNSLDCGAFSVLNGRYGCKMIWLIPFCALCLLVSNINLKINSSSRDNRN